MTEQLSINTDKPVKRKKKRQGRERTKEYLFKLLLYLNPDATSIDDITIYLYGKITTKKTRSSYGYIHRLRNMGWLISRATYRLNHLQYMMLQAAHAKRGRKLKLIRLEPNVIAAIAMG